MNKIPAKRLFISAADFFDDEIKIDYLVKRLLERNTTGQWFGPWAQGKSFLTYDLSVSVATGGKFAGHQCEQGLVLYLAGEGHHGGKRRVKAIGKTRGLAANDLRLLHISASTILFDGSNLDAVILEARQLEQTLGAKISLIIVDTMARHMTGDENSNRDAGQFIRSVDGLREEFPGSVALIVHHSGNSEGNLNRGRGASCVPGAMDFIAMIDKGRLTFQKMKEAEKPDPIDFKLMTVEIGTDDEGQPITSCVVNFGERSTKHRQESLTPTEQIVAKLLAAGGGRMNSNDLRQQLYAERVARDPEVKISANKTAWLRAIEGLTAKNMISIVGDTICTEHGTERNKTSQCSGGQA